MTSLAVLAGYNGITEAEFQTLDVNGFYGPGSWAPWFITLFASWIAILRDDYTHNAHFIAYALYTNWAAMNIIQLLSVDRKFAELHSDVEESLQQVASVKLPFSFIPKDPDDKLSLCKFRNTTRGRHDSILLNADPENPIWRWTMARHESSYLDDASQYEHKIRLQTQLAAHTDTCIQLVSLWVQSMAAKAVLRVGTLCAFSQTLVVRLKIKVDQITFSGAGKGYWKRLLFIFLGLPFPSVAWIILFYRKLTDETSGPATMAMSVSGSMMIMGLTGLNFMPTGARIVPTFGLRTTPLAVLDLIVITLLSIVLLAVCVQYGEILPEPFEGRSQRCLYFPCTPVKISELDQSFGLFAALSLFLYEFVPLLPAFSKFLWYRLKRLFLWVRSCRASVF